MCPLEGKLFFSGQSHSHYTEAMLRRLNRLFKKKKHRAHDLEGENGGDTERGRIQWEEMGTHVFDQNIR